MTTNHTGRYRFTSVPVGTYDVTASTGGCLKSRTKIVVIDGVWPRQSREEFRGDERKRFRLAPAADSYGHRCLEEPSDYVEADTLLPLTGDDDALPVDLPFDFRFYGDQYNEAYVSTNGNLNFLDLQALVSNTGLPDPQIPNTTIAPFWDDLEIRADSAVYSATGGTAPDRWFTIEYRNAAFYNEADDVRVDVEVTLHEGGDIVFSYRNLDPTSDLETGGSATAGIENKTGTVGLEYSFGDAVLDNETAIRFLLPPGGIATGMITDANDDLPVAGASVRAWQDDEVVRETTTDADGDYLLQLPLGTYTLEASNTNYASETAGLTIDEEEETVVTDFALDTGLPAVAPGSLQFELAPGQQATAEVTITNDGTVDLVWELAEVDHGSGPAARQDPGDVLAEWPTVGLHSPWGIGYDGEGDVWVAGPSEVTGEWTNKEYRADGTPTGVVHRTDWAEYSADDMAFDVNTGTMCQIETTLDFVNGDIHCWDPGTGDVTYVVPSTDQEWGSVPQVGLGYNVAEDVFYIGGWSGGVVYTVAGQTHASAGAVLNQCTPEDTSISGLAYNATSGTLWMATNTPQDTIYHITPEDCATISTLDDPGPSEHSAIGMELDVAGNIWLADLNERVVRLIESGVPVESDVPWLSEAPISGELAPGETDTFTVTVDAAGLGSGTTYEATVLVKSNAGRVPLVYLPVQLIVHAEEGGVGANTYERRTGDSG